MSFSSFLKIKNKGTRKCTVFSCYRFCIILRVRWGTRIQVGEDSSLHHLHLIMPTASRLRTVTLALHTTRAARRATTTLRRLTATPHRLYRLLPRPAAASTGSFRGLLTTTRPSIRLGQSYMLAVKDVRRAWSQPQVNFFYVWIFLVSDNLLCHLRLQMLFGGQD